MWQSPTVDTLSAFFLICFGIGLLTSLGALLLGAHAHGSPDGHGGDFSHVAPGGILSQGGIHSADLAYSGTTGTHSVGAGGQGTHTHGGAGQTEGPEQISVFNLTTFLGFLLGFGAAGFAVKQAWGGIPLLLNVLAAAAGGLVFAGLIYWVLAKVLVKGQSEYLQASDFDLTGIEGTISSTIFRDHLGEVSYVLHRSRAAAPARERDGREVKKGEPVVIVEVSQGVAVVLPKSEFMHHAQTKKEEE